jgi:hypothetical protein
VTVATRARRRTKVEVVRDRETAWIANAAEGYAQYGLCLACGEIAHVRGKTREAVKCRGCFIGNRPLRFTVTHERR